MSLESDIEILGAVALFADLTHDQLRLLAFGAERRSVRAGEYLYRAEARADAGFVLVAGEVDLVLGEGEEARTVSTVGPGALLGELALVIETRRGSNAMTRTDCEVIRISRPLFRRMLQEFPAIALTLRERIAGDLVGLTDAVSAIEPRFRD